MKSSIQFIAMLAVLAAPLTAVAAEEEEAASLQSYSVGDRRGLIEQEKVVIERPKFENNFKIETPKPSLGSLQLAKPKLEVLPPTGGVEAEPPAPAAAGSSPSVGGTGGETRSVKPLRMDPPDYPRDALRRREEGHVVVEFTINAEGRTEEINVVEAEPRGSFENEARRAVSRWMFEPALRDGRPIPQRIRHTLEFTLD